MEPLRTPESIAPTARPIERRATGSLSASGTKRRTKRRHPLGPLWQMVRLDSPVGGRVYVAGIAAAMAALFVVAARLHSEGYDHGVHQQLGLPPCGFLVITGLPCPTCGMTTAFANTIHGHLISAVYAQPAGFILAVLGLVTGIAAFAALLTGRRPAFNWYRINPLHVVWGSCALFVAAWGVKIVLYLLAHGPA